MAVWGRGEGALPQAGGITLIRQKTEKLRFRQPDPSFMEGLQRAAPGIFTKFLGFSLIHIFLIIIYIFLEFSNFLPRFALNSINIESTLSIFCAHWGVEGWACHPTAIRV